MFEILPVNTRGILAFKASGKLTDADYQQFLPRLESLIRESGTISLYIELEDFHGWEPKAAWDDLHFGLQHDRDFRRIAIVGDRDWEPAAITLANLFVHTDMRFFSREDAKSAWAWLEEAPQQDQEDESMQPYRKLLLATDFSPSSEHAARRAIELAGRYGARIEMLHIVEEAVFYNEWDDSLIADIPLQDEALMESARDGMKRFAERTGLGKEVRQEVQWGNPKRSIVSWAREQGVDLIVTGSHGRHGIERLLGSVSTSVLHHAPCDVLIVRAQDQ